MEASAPPRLASGAPGSDLDFEALRRDLARQLSGPETTSLAHKVGEEIDDVVNRSMERLWKQLLEGKEIPKPGAWLYTTSWNYLKNQGRDHRTHPTAPVDPDSVVLNGDSDSVLPEDQVHARLSQQTFERLADELDERDRKLLLLADAGLTARETADVVSRSGKRISKTTCNRRLKVVVETVAKGIKQGSDSSHIRRAAITIVAAQLAGRPVERKLAREAKDNLALAHEVASIKQAIGGVVAVLSPEEVISLHEHHASLIERGAAVADRVREFAYSHVHRVTSGDAETAGGLAGGGVGASAAAKTLIAACIAGGGAVGVGGACLATGVVHLPGKGSTSVAEQTVPGEPTTSVPTSTGPEQASNTPPAPTEGEAVTTTAEKPAQQVTKELYGGGATSGSAGSSLGSRDFAAPLGGSSTSGGGGGGSSGGSRENFGP